MLIDIREPSTTDTRRDRPVRGRRRLQIAIVVLGGAAAASALCWWGLRVDPEPLDAPAVEIGDVTTVPLPVGLPAPVERFYTSLYGDRVPVVDSAVITGRGRMRIAGISFPARFRFSHVTGAAYRHYIELTAFGRRVMAVDEWFVDGAGRLELPFGVSEGPQVDQGANLALWAEAVWMPSVWVTDPAVEWEPVDDTTARLTVPFGDTTETFTTRFDPGTGLLQSLESMRFKRADDTDKTLWTNEVTTWNRVGDRLLPQGVTLTWADEGGPWADLRVEEVVYNADLETYIRASGP